MDSEVEFVARALYAAENEDRAWEGEPEAVKEEFRSYACAALRLLARHRAHDLLLSETAPFPYAA